MPRGGFRENAGGWNAKGFWGSITLEESTGCWNWNNPTHKFGYGQISYLGRKVDAHRAAAHLWLKLPIGSPLVVRHTCDNPRCCNPKHLELGTALDNITDMMTRKGHYKSKRTECPSGHPYNETNTYWSKDGKYRRCRTCDKAHRT